jgi:hypothetical protein
MSWKSFGGKSTFSQHHLFLRFFFLKQELNVPLLLAFRSIVASELLSSLSLISFPLSSTLSPCLQTIPCLLDLIELDIIHPLAYSSNTTLAPNLSIMGLNQVVDGCTKLSILF